MTEFSVREAFTGWVETRALPLDTHPKLAIAALMTIAAFGDPVSQVPIFDAIAAAVAASADGQARAAVIRTALPWVDGGLPRVAVPAGLWDAFWSVTLDPPAVAQDSLDLTAAVVALGHHYDQQLIDKCEAALLAFDCVHDLVAQPEVRMQTGDLEGHATDSLATELLSMLRTNGYDLEVIDADTVVLAGDYPAQNRTNRRILQLHDIWHLVGGYGFTGAGEVAISSFQLAQFGQNYSTRFLAVVTTIAAIRKPAFLDFLLNVIVDGWRHGRETRPLLAVPWHLRIAEPITQIRTDFGIVPLDSAAVRLLESFASANT